MSKMTKTKNVPVISLGTRYIQVLGIPKSITQSRDSATIVVAQSRDCTLGMRNLEIAQCPHVNSRLACNFRIPRLHKFLNCAEHIYCSIYS